MNSPVDRASGLTPPVVELKDVTVAYRSPGGTVTALNQASLAIGQGDSVAVVGRSGSGKSSLVSVLGLMRRPVSGEVAIDGQLLPLTQRAMRQARAASVGMVFQSFHLEPHLTCVENCMLSWYATSRSIGYRTARNRALDLAELVGLGSLAYRRVANMSGGERQRVAIARALFAKPRLIIADEPTGNLDEDTAGAISNLLWSLPQTSGTAVVVVTHDTDVAAGASRTVNLVKGTIQEIP